MGTKERVGLIFKLKICKQLYIYMKLQENLQEDFGKLPDLLICKIHLLLFLSKCSTEWTEKHDKKAEGWRNPGRVGNLGMAYDTCRD